MGTPQIAAATLAELLTGPDSVVGVVTQPDRTAGTRPDKLRHRRYENWPKSHAIPVLAAEKIRTPEFLGIARQLAARHYRCGCLRTDLAEIDSRACPHGCLNVHYSLLPKYRGAAPAAWTIINGETRSRRDHDEASGKNGRRRDLSSRTLSALAVTKPRGSLQAKLTPVGARSVARYAAPAQRWFPKRHANKMKAWRPLRRS